MFSPQKAGSRTFVLCLTWLPGQGEKQQENSCLELSPGEPCCTFPGHVFCFCMSSKVLCQYSHHRKQGAEPLRCASHGCHAQWEAAREFLPGTFSRGISQFPRDSWQQLQGGSQPKGIGVGIGDVSLPWSC